MKNIFKNVGYDKYAHLGIGGLICAFIATVLILQDGMLNWYALWYALVGTFVVFGLSLFKEYFMDEKFEWADIVWAMFGCAIYTVSLIAGIGFYLVSH